jgi:hypothetical protein
MHDVIVQRARFTESQLRDGTKSIAKFIAEIDGRQPSAIAACAHLIQASQAFAGAFKDVQTLLELMTPILAQEEAAQAAAAAPEVSCHV